VQAPWKAETNEATNEQKIFRIEFSSFVQFYLPFL
jgi:hypothetical protein